jgi:N6-L-threonylcarbamoyladenine synthase
LKYVLGLDTSNYTTSVALLDSNYRIIYDLRQPIKVKEGMKGIRQSEALFQHSENLPQMLDSVLRKYANDIIGVSVSTRPRPIKESYMPVFKAGINAGNIIASTLNIPLFETSHQEGHIEAAKYNKDGEHLHNFDSNEKIALFHLSGGTTEILLDNKIIGGSKDISFGQLIDRLGVSAGFSFPAGKKLGEIACTKLKEIGSYDKIKSMALKEFKHISRSKNELYVNLSGLDSQIKRIIEGNQGSNKCQFNLERLITEVFYLISDCLKTLTKDIKKQYNIMYVIFVGGVSSSKFIREYIISETNESSVRIHFAQPELSVDNAVGVAALGGRQHGFKTRIGQTT